MAVITGDCRDLLPELLTGEVDSIVCDPPYELGFMGKHWDRTGIAYHPKVWTEALRVLKPGGYLLSFGGTRTYHRIACAIEDAGFEIVDSLHWFYGKGFPKAKSNLKPAHEPIVLARKPAKNVQHLQIDACRIGIGKPVPGGGSGRVGNFAGKTQSDAPLSDHRQQPHNLGRWPANVLFTHDDDCVLVGTKKVKSNGHRPKNTGNKTMWAGTGGGLNGREQDEDWTGDENGEEEVEDWACAWGCPIRVLDLQSGGVGAHTKVKGTEQSDPTDLIYNKMGRVPGVFHGDRGGASRFFYCTKASRAERDEGLEDMPDILLGHSNQAQTRIADGAGPDHQPGAREMGLNRIKTVKNPHPTVKPIEVMRWLTRLVTPPGGLVVDPFTGSGTTGVAAVLEGFDFIGFEINPDYVVIAEKRIQHYLKEKTA